MSEKHIPNYEAPMRVQGVNPKTVQCKDCVYRDKTMFDNHGTKIPIEVIGSYCEVYTEEISNGKPSGVLFEYEKCKYYMKEDE